MPMKTLRISILLFVFAVFVSCDCLQHVQGTVIDAETQQPIRDVIVKRNTYQVCYTDSLGTFEFRVIAGGLFGCPNISVYFEKEGYNKITKQYPSCCTENDIIVLEKQAK
jgi:hypothetical protein